MKVKRNIIKELRVSRGWTQEHLAHLCDCSVRTIARAEKDGVNSMETITALAAVFGVEASQLMGMDKIEQLQQKTDEGERYLIRLHSGKMIVESFIESLAYKIDYEIPRNSKDADLISSVIQEIKDWGEIWGDLDVGEQIRASYRLNEIISEIEENGLVLFGLRTREKLNIFSQEIEGFLCNLFISYKDNERIVILGSDM